MADSGDIRRPEILDGPAFDWEEGARMAAAAVRPDGEVNWGAAFAADPGVCRCPGCGALYWQEGVRVRCLDCRFEFPSDWSYQFRMAQQHRRHADPADPAHRPAYDRPGAGPRRPDDPYYMHGWHNPGITYGEIAGIDWRRVTGEEPRCQ